MMCSTFWTAVGQSSALLCGILAFVGLIWFLNNLHELFNDVQRNAASLSIAHGKIDDLNLEKSLHRDSLAHNEVRLNNIKAEINSLIVITQMLQDKEAKRKEKGDRQ